jgi:hypothetical protein
MAHKRVTVLDVESHPWYEPTSIELSAIGAHVASKVTLEDRILYSLWKPCPDLPPDDELGRALYYRARLKLKDGRLFEGFGEERFFPHIMKGWMETPNAARIRRMMKLWDVFSPERVRLNLELIYPEASEGFMTSAGINVIVGERVTTSDLDSITAAKQTLDSYIGFKVSHDILGRSGTLIKLDCGKFAVRWRITCQSEGRKCKNRTTLYTVSGCHHGAWCYSVDKQGKHLADLRNQSAVCEKCAR